jgi:hypothetical protein
MRSAKLSAAFEPFEDNVVAWTATSASQLAMVDIEGAYRGVFTSRFVAGLLRMKADADKDGRVSHADLLEYVTAEQAKYCARNPEQCPFGATPTLEAPQRLANADIVTGEPIVAPFDVCSGLVKGNAAGVAIDVERQGGDRAGGDIRFRVETKTGGDFILFEAGPSGEITMLLPDPTKAINRYRLRSGGSVSIPDSEELGYAWFKTEPPAGRYRLYGLLSSEAIDSQKLRNSISGAGGRKAFCQALSEEIGKRAVSGDGTVKRGRISLGVADYEIKP